jgi:hypothetical protein
MFVKPVERDAARQRRRDEGRSIREIASLLQVSVSSVSRWTADITLSPGFIEALRQRNPAINSRLNGTREQSAAARALRLDDQQRGRELARHPTRLHLAGCMLFWAEGSKHRNRVTLTNSDADLVALFVRFLTQCHDVQPERITLTVNCHLNNGLELEEIEAWWLSHTGLPAESLRKAAVNRVSRLSMASQRPPPWNGQRVGPLDRDRAEHLRGDSGVRGHRAAGVGRWPHTIRSAPVAQRSERRPFKSADAGSTPAGGTTPRPRPGSGRLLGCGLGLGLGRLPGGRRWRWGSP